MANSCGPVAASRTTSAVIALLRPLWPTGMYCTGAGMEGFNRVWQDEANLPTPEEIADPARWVRRVAKG